MSRFAENTEVSSERSKAEIESLVKRYGAKQFISGWDDTSAKLQFVIGNKTVRFVLVLPTNAEVSKTPTGRARRGNAAHDAVEKETRRRWRALALILKAKFEAVESKIFSFEHEFGFHVVLPGENKTVGEVIVPQIEKAVLTGHTTAFLLGSGTPR